MLFCTSRISTRFSPLNSTSAIGRSANVSSSMSWADADGSAARSAVSSRASVRLRTSVRIRTGTSIGTTNPPHDRGAVPGRRNVEGPVCMNRAEYPGGHGDAPSSRREGGSTGRSITGPSALGRSRMLGGSSGGQIRIESSSPIPVAAMASRKKTSRSEPCVVLVVVLVGIVLPPRVPGTVPPDATERASNPDIAMQAGIHRSVASPPARPARSAESEVTR